MISLALTIAARAAEPIDPFDETDESELFGLDETLVTVASRYAQTTAQAPSIVTVIDNKTMRERGYRTVSDALRDLPGIYVWRSDEGRDLASFRGVIASDNNKVLLLVDGVPWYDGVYTHAFIDDYLPIGIVKQIEVIKGPGSAIYGTNAFAGVINVVTWDAASLQGARVRWDVGGNSRSDLSAVLGGTERVGTFDVGMSGYVRVLQMQGFGLDEGPDLRRNVLGEDPRNGIAAGVHLTVQNLSVQIHHVDYRRTYLTRQWADNPFGALGAETDTTGVHNHDTMFDLRYAWAPTSAITITPHLSSQRHDDPGAYYYFTGITTEDPELDGTGTGTLGYRIVETEKNTRRWGYGLDFDARPGIDHHVVAGIGNEETSSLELADYSYDQDGNVKWTGYGLPEVAPTADVQPADFRDPNSANAKLCNVFAYGQYEWIPAPGLQIVAGGRVDRRYTCGPELPIIDGAQVALTDVNHSLQASPRLALLLVPNQHLVAKVLYGEAFRYGTMREVLVLANRKDDGRWAFTNGDPGLLPERIRTAEAEVRGHTGPLEAGVNVYASQVTNEIDKILVPDPVDPVQQQAGWGSRYGNVDSDLGIVGGEIDATVKSGDLVTLHIAYALALTRYTGGGEWDGRSQYEFPAQMGKGQLRIAPTDHLSGTLSSEVYGARPRAEWSPTAGNEDGAPFGLLNLAVSLDDLGPDGRFAITGGVRNLASTDWDTGVYRDMIDMVDNDAAEFPIGLQGEPRLVHAMVEGRF